MSALGHKQTFAPQKTHVHFTPESEHSQNDQRKLIDAQANEAASLGSLADNLSPARWQSADRTPTGLFPLAPPRRTLPPFQPDFAP